MIHIDREQLQNWFLVKQLQAYDNFEERTKTVIILGLLAHT